MKRVTKKIIAKAINDHFDKIKLPFSVDPNEIEQTRFSRDQYEGGATHHHIVAKHKTNKTFLTIPVYTMEGFKSMQDEMKMFPERKLTISRLGDVHSEFWIYVQ